MTYREKYIKEIEEISNNDELSLEEKKSEYKKVNREYEKTEFLIRGGLILFIMLGLLLIRFLLIHFCCRLAIGFESSPLIIFYLIILVYMFIAPFLYGRLLRTFINHKTKSEKEFDD